MTNFAIVKEEERDNLIALKNVAIGIFPVTAIASYHFLPLAPGLKYGEDQI
jgi:nitrate reductase NapE component